MTRPTQDDLTLWQQRRDQALLDLSELQAQVDQDDMPASVAEPLRRLYRRTAADAIAAIEAATRTTSGTSEVSQEQQDAALPDRSTDEQPAAAGAGTRHRRSRAWAAAYAGGAVIALVALFLLPRYVGARPAGGFVTGNEMLQAPPGAGATAGPGTAAQTPVPVPSGSPTSGRDLSKVSTAEMEQVVAANPQVVGMRLALARRYLLAGQYPSAARHYAAVLQQQPDNVQARAGSAWILLKVGQPRQALSSVERALAVDGRSVDALWVKANIELYGLSNPAGALEVLAQLRALPDVPNSIDAQASRLADFARSRQRGGS